MARGCQTGTQALALAVKNVYPELQSLTNTYGCFNRRKIAGSNSWSLHAEGRACVQRVMWDAHIWSVERIDEWRKIQGGDKHYDHIHVEQYWTAALRPRSMQTPYEEQLRDGRGPKAS